MRVTCLQMRVRPCEKESNLSTAMDMLGEALDAGAELVVLPEVFSTGFCYEHMQELAEEPPYPTIQRLAEEAGTAVVIGSIIEQKNNEFYNLGFCIDGGRLVDEYRKTHPFGREKQSFTPGDRLRVFETSLGRIGLEICYEIRFPEVARFLTLNGADILVTIGEFPSSREYHWRSLAIARAIENLIPHVACNCVGRDSLAEYSGGSLILDAWGEVIVDGGPAEGVVVGEIDLSGRDRARSAISCLRDRRPDLY